ncbi:MAG: sigma-70 family RNA polymerase sigma factor [Marvinbryantia sp.]|jgi:RNA polymerase sigma factor (sigma-70 family)
MLTLWEIKQSIQYPDKKNKVPTAKYLQDSEIVIVSKCLDIGTEVKVYQCGYAVYRIGKYVTVFSVHDCNDYFYHSCGKDICIEGRFFDCQAWYIRLILEGEDRVSHNQESRDQEKHISYSAVAEDWNLLSGAEQSPLERFLEKELIREIMESLTERQRLIFVQFFLYQKTQKEIAKELDVSAPIISKTISNAIRKIRKKYPELGECYTSSSGGSKKKGNVYAW